MTQIVHTVVLLCCIIEGEDLRRGEKMATAIWKKIAAGEIDPVYLLTGSNNIFSIQR